MTSVTSEQFHDRIHDNYMYGLWELASQMTPHPMPKAKSHIWKWGLIESVLQDSGEVVPIGEERRHSLSRSDTLLEEHVRRAVDQRAERGPVEAGVAEDHSRARRTMTGGAGREIADPPLPLPAPMDAPEPIPVEALPDRRRRQYHNRRREHDPLGEGHACTWRTRLIKVAAEILVRARCIRVRLSGHWPYLDHFRRVSEAVLQLPPSILLSPD